LIQQHPEATPSMHSMANKSKTVRKKKKISKHVLKSRETTAEKATTTLTENPNPQEQQPTVSTSPATGLSKKEKKKNRRMKDPSEAATYLEEWKQSKQQDTKKESNWKFNKNTQSWLIRHMYDADKIPKATFALLLEYLAGLEGKTTRVWIRSEATRRALRYKQYEKEQSGRVEKEEKAATTTADGKKEVTESNEKAANDGKSTNDDEREEQARWEKLNDHDKRKEYKRARKVLESINE